MHRTLFSQSWGAHLMPYALTRPPPSPSIQYDNGISRHTCGRNQAAQASEPAPRDRRMHLARDAPPYGGVGNGSRRTAANSIIEVATATIPAPCLAVDATSTDGSIDANLQNSLLLACIVLEQRGRSDDDRIEQASWGRRTAGGAGAASEFLLSVSGLQLSRTQSEPISEILNALSRSTQTGVASDQCKTFYFNEGKVTRLSSRKHQPDHEGQTWLSRLEAVRDGQNLTLRILRNDTNGSSAGRQAPGKLEALVEILGVITKTPEKPIAVLFDPFGCDSDQIWQWNAELPPTIDRCIHDIISEQAGTRPEKVAVSSWDGRFTYAEVESMSTRLALYLVAQGIVVGTIVPLCFEKSRWTIVALLAVIKAGGGFALTDPTSQPEARLKAMVEQTGGSLIVASQGQSDLAQQIVPKDGQVVTVSDELFTTLSNGIEGTSASLPLIPTLTTPLYIQFTSGSTGRPKGVVVSHSNYTSGAIPRAAVVGYTSTSRVFEFASYAFDVSIDCMLCTLAMGGTICIPSDADRMNDLGGAIAASGANMAHMTPSVARVLDPKVISGLDVLGLGGEAVSAADAAAWSKGKTSVIIAYGPSECTVGCTVNNTFAHGRGDDERKLFTTGNIGKGVGGVGWIADPQDSERLVPVGAVGELLIEGPVVGLGYLGELEKTAEVFIDDPAWLVAGHGATPGRRGRLYKTGDLVRYDADGSGDIVFVGRKDAQVKLRGQRVELVEIEHHLGSRLPGGVKIAAEVIKPIGGEPTLVVFACDPNSASGSPREAASDVDAEPLAFSAEMVEALADIDESLASDLPRYMVPAAYIPLHEMPFLVSGKIDRKKLRKHGATLTREELAASNRRNKKGGSKHPETDTERALCRVWQALLGDRVEISAQDSFFALGGDSLRAMKLVSLARSEGIAITVADVFRYPVLRDMAVVATKIPSSEEGSNFQHPVPPFSLLETDWNAEDARSEASRLCGVDEADIEDVYPCTPLQEALMALSAKVREAYVAQRVLKMDNMESAKRLKTAFEAVSADSSIMRTRIVQVSKRGLMQVLVKGPVVWRSAGSLAEYLKKDREEQMDLGKPLVRYAMIMEGGNAHFVLSMHHALYDGWSMPLVVDRVNRSYQGLPLQQPAADFKDFIHYLNHSLDRAACDAYWRDQLAGATGVQFPRLPFEGYQTQADSLLELEVQLDDRRPPACTNATVTLATVIRAAWALVASQYCSGNHDMVFGETLTGRNAPIVGADEIEGPMITTVPVRVSIDHDATVEQYLQSIAEQMINQIPHEHAGLQHIRRLSDDALQACELRTGLVLHPAAGEVAVDENTPANGLVPAGDAEAAQEALKFNTYALMLVCALSTDGFLVMASFDSHTVDKDTVQRVLGQLRIVVLQLCDQDARQRRIGDVQCLTEADLHELQLLGSQVKMPSADSDTLEFEFADGFESLWIVDAADSQRLVPSGAVGELLIETRSQLPAPAVAVARPDWANRVDSEQLARQSRFYRTSRLARFDFSSADSPTFRVLPKTSQPKAAAAARNLTQPTATAPAVTATSAKQKTLRAIWARLLNVDEDTIYLGDSFFARGGDSITAMKLVSEARQQGMHITVALVFANRTLYDMAKVLQNAPTPTPTPTPKSTPATSGSSEAVATELAIVAGRAAEYQPMALFLSFFMGRFRDQLADKTWKISDVIPTRPLQEIAVRGTVELPRFSLRYELLHFNGMVDKTRLFTACQELVSRNEILRTVFVRVDGTCYGVVLDSLPIPVIEYEIDGDSTEEFASQLCRVDAQTRIPYGSSFVKWFFITNGNQCSLAFRLSHAQYDEICLPIFLNQLHQLYQDPKAVSPSFPFSAFVNHTLRDSIPRAIPYWRDLLAGSRGISVLLPGIPVTSRRHFAIHRSVNISARSRDVTVATLPSAAWALTLARRLHVSDVVFGEVASGRSVDIPGVPDANVIAGPCWQYVPTRVRFDSEPPIKTGHDLLAALQHQHMTTSSHDSMGLDEIVRQCTDWDPETTTWFDTVVHQDVAHVETLSFVGQTAKFETLYPYEEPLREWKIQAFHDGDTLTLEVVTYESWKDHAVKLLDDVVTSLEQLVQRPWDQLDVV